MSKLLCCGEKRKSSIFGCNFTRCNKKKEKRKKKKERIGGVKKRKNFYLVEHLSSP